MPISFTIEPHQQSIRTKITGGLFDSDLVGYLDAALAHPDYRPGLRTLVVAEGVRLGTISTPAIRRLADVTRRIESEIGATRVAIVASQTAVYGIARMYQLLRDAPYPIHVFRKLEEAEAWLAAEPLAGGDPELQAGA